MKIGTGDTLPTIINNPTRNNIAIRGTNHHFLVLLK